jgi:hypothetical protein
MTDYSLADFINGYRYKFTFLSVYYCYSHK